MQAVQIRVAKEKKPDKSIGHREFNDFERQLNKLTTSQEFYDYFYTKPDPYYYKSLPDEAFKKNSTFPYNPFHAMPEHRLKELMKYMEHTSHWQEEHVLPIINAARWIFNIFKDLTHLTTSECVALSFEAQKRIQNTNPNVKRWIEEDNYKNNTAAQEATAILHSVIAEFPEHWNAWMDEIQHWKIKGHRKIEFDKK